MAKRQVRAKRTAPGFPAAGSERATLADDVAEKLRSDIVSARFRPSERLRFEDLSQRYGVSVSPIREALSRLTAENLVEPDAQRGFRVASISQADLIGILESQKILEAIALRRSIHAKDDSWEGELLAAQHRLMRMEASRKDQPSAQWTEEWEQRHRAFHQALVSGCDLTWLQRFCEVLRDQLDRYRNISGVPPWRFPSVSMQHGPIVQAALAGDADRASSLLIEHYDAAAKIIVEALGHAKLSAEGELQT